MLKAVVIEGFTSTYQYPNPKEMKTVKSKTSYPRNKIRTAKYTPLTFIPKNIWFQFHNIANIYFLFIIILGVRPRSRAAEASAGRLLLRLT